MNIVAITGKVATEIKRRNAGQSVVTSINLAVKDDFKRDTTHFIKVEAWGKTAELLEQYCQKGSKIGIQGSLKVDKFQDKEGNNREITKVNASRVEFLDSKGSNNGVQGQSNQNGTNTPGGQTRGTQPSQNAPEENPFANQDGSVDIQESELPFTEVIR